MPGGSSILTPIYYSTIQSDDFGYLRDHVVRNTVYTWLTTKSDFLKYINSDIFHEECSVFIETCCVYISVEHMHSLLTTSSLRQPQLSNTDRLVSAPA